ncbi:hypothetical protein AAFH68_17100 [Flavobacterium sp. CGRL1]
MVLVYKTSVTDPQIAEKITQSLEKALGAQKVNFDLEDCDNILRIESSSVDKEMVQEILHQYSHQAEML